MLTPSMVSTLYFRNGIADLCCGLGVLLQLPLLPPLTSGSGFKTGLVCGSYFVSAVAVRMSVFSNCLIGVTRCINIISPFYRVNVTWITIATLLYAAFW